MLQGLFCALSVSNFITRLKVRHFASRKTIAMRNFVAMLALLSFVSFSCSREGPSDNLPDEEYQSPNDVPHEMIVLGEKLDDPYAVENVKSAIASLYPTKAGQIEIEPTDIYVRFLPKNEEEFSRLSSMKMLLLDHPIDYSIVREGDYYHDPSIADDCITWQYAVVKPDFVFPTGIRYEVLEQCFIADANVDTKAFDGLDWSQIEREAFRLTGNEALLEPDTKADGESSYPSGQIQIIDDRYNNGEAIGVAGVKVSCNTFVKFASAYTDVEGNYKMDKAFNTSLRYRLVFQNEKGFAIGFNKVLVSASTSTLGKNSPEGVSIVIDTSSDRNLFCRSAVNNAAYDYYENCSREDEKISLPPANTRLWLFQFLSSSSTMMLQQGVLVDNTKIGEFLGDYKTLVKMFLPDITLGVSNLEHYCSIYAITLHELAHASHFSQVGKEYWNKYFAYVLNSYLASSGKMYGTGSEENAGYCEVGEMWSYYVQNRMYQDRYGETSYVFGNDYWFYPQILLYLDERGLSMSNIAKALTSSVTSRDEFAAKLEELNPDCSTVIRQAFDRYKN